MAEKMVALRAEWSAEMKVAHLVGSMVEQMAGSKAGKWAECSADWKVAC